MKDFREFLRSYMDLMQDAAKIPLACYRTPEWPDQQVGAPTALIISAHPDDEILTGMPLAIRCKWAGWRVVNLAMTLGRPSQYERRRRELNAACVHAGMDLVVPLENGLRDLIRSSSAADKDKAVSEVSAVIKRLQPKLIIVHHDEDGHPDHTESNRITLLAIEGLDLGECFFAEGEYWQDVVKPNFQVEVSEDDFVVMLEALSFHAEELARNPYHVFWPPFLHLNSRFAEVVMGYGTPAAAYNFSAMYRLSPVTNRGVLDPLRPLQLAADDSIDKIFQSD